MQCTQAAVKRHFPRPISRIDGGTQHFHNSSQIHEPVPPDKPFRPRHRRTFKFKRRFSRSIFRAVTAKFPFLQSTKKKPAAADELHMLKTGLEPVRIAPRDFKSPASAISPLQPILFYVMRREIIPPRPIRSSIVPAYVAHAVKDSAASEKSAAAVKSPACPIGVSRSAQARCVLSSPSPQPFRQLIEPANILCRDHDRPVQNRLLLP